MRKVRCYECGKSYDFDVDDFCPKCGAFNQPPRDVCIGADGAVIRVDGINERNHRESFVHTELHEENRERRAVGLSKGVKRTGKAVVRPASPAPRKQERKADNKSPWAVISWIIFIIIALNFLGNLGFLFF